ncbi:trypsin-7-like [Hetaerina americana]|uniref:trypsin-7-like n=1 Tax=Hetaerina americana TaxID=62018 RepID=UPI003A7F2872
MATSVFVIAILFATCRGEVLSTSRSLLNGNAINAEKIEAYMVPYQVDIRHNGQHVCSGAVLGIYDVLTTAHCVKWLRAEDITVIVGSIVLNATEGMNLVEEIQTHPLFDPYTLDYDAAIIKVKVPFRFGSYVDSLPLPQVVDDIPPGSSALVSGWASKSGNEDDFLRAANVTVISQDDCNPMYPNQPGISDRMICSGASLDASVPTGCLADPGAPLVADGKLYGVASWGRACTPGNPNVVVYTHISKLEHFTRRNTFIHRRAKAEVCAVLQLVSSLLPKIPVVPVWVISSRKFLLNLLSC